MNEAWKEYRNDFNAMTDEQIEQEVRQSEEQLNEAESWLEAVASWKAAGKPRDEPEKIGIVPRDARHHAELDATHRKHPDGSYFK